LIDQFNELYLFLNTPQNSFNIFIGFTVLALSAAVLRIIVAAGYGAQLALFQLAAKEIKSISETKDTRSPLLNRIIKDYIRTGDKGVVPKSAQAVVERHINRLNVLGWGYGGMSAFVLSIESSIVFLGLILAFVFEEFRYVFAISAVAAFVAHRIIAALFDFASARERLSLETAEYVDREIGQFYSGDSASLILRLKNELSASMTRQSETLSDGIKKMGENMSAAMQLSLREMSRSIDSTMIRVSDFGGELSAPLDKWKKAVGEAAAAQDKFGFGIKSFDKISDDLRESAKTLSAALAGHSEAMRAQGEAMRGEMAALTEIAAALKGSSGPLLTQGDGIAGQLKYIERNQETLEHSLQRFELIMEDMTRKLGDGFGSMIDYHVQSSYGTLNTALADNIKQIVAANNELTERMREIFEQILEQSRSESQTVLKIKEQMDLHFESLKKE